jgi:hypothetical protein
MGLKTSTPNKLPKGEKGIWNTQPKLPKGERKGFGILNPSCPRERKGFGILNQVAQGREKGIGNTQPSCPKGKTNPKSSIQVAWKQLHYKERKLSPKRKTTKWQIQSSCVGERNRI